MLAFDRKAHKNRWADWVYLQWVCFTSSEVVKKWDTRIFSVCLIHSFSSVMTCTFVITSKTWGLKIFDTHFSKTWLCLVPKFQYFTAIVHFGDIVQGETSRLLVLNQLTLKALEKAV